MSWVLLGFVVGLVAYQAGGLLGFGLLVLGMATGGIAGAAQERTRHQRSRLRP